MEQPRQKPPAEQPRFKPPVAQRPPQLGPRPGTIGQRQPPRTVPPGERRGVWQRYRARSWRAEHRDWRQRGGYRGYRIPDYRFRLWFGRNHRFHISRFELRIYGGFPQFFVNGYWFALYDPVPEYWPYDWYETDYCYIVLLEDGYYLVDTRYPRDLIAIGIYLP